MRRIKLCLEYAARNLLLADRQRGSAPKVRIKRQGAEVQKAVQVSRNFRAFFLQRELVLPRFDERKKSVPGSGFSETHWIRGRPSRFGERPHQAPGGGDFKKTA